MSKIKIIIPTVAIVALMFILFWKRLFSVNTAYDTKFFTGYICVLILFMFATYMFHFKNEFINFIPPVILCVGTLVALVMYKNWNDDGYYINADDVESIIYTYYDENQKPTFRDVEVDYTDKKEEIIDRYNNADCVKNWDMLGDYIGYDTWIRIHLKDGTRITIDPADFVSISKRGSESRKYKTSVSIEELLP